eukprot:5537893-Pleurochrysis_carterae.AAC.2
MSLQNPAGNRAATKRPSEAVTKFCPHAAFRSWTWDIRSCARAGIDSKISQSLNDRVSNDFTSVC